MARKSPIKGLYYITHVDNLASIMQNGILSHALVEERGIPFRRIYDANIVSRRQNRLTPTGASLWRFANLYFQPRNPMLYRVIHSGEKNDIAILRVNPDVLKTHGAFVSTGNAASAPSDILPVSEGIKEIIEMWPIIQSEWWREEDGTKRKIMAECLVPDLIPPQMIQTIYVTSHSAVNKIRQVAPNLSVSVVPEPAMFFQPTKSTRIAPLLSLVDGDMFFTQMSTLTISVNTVGVMGKGLASRAKYQFPDVYVQYQDVCKQKKLEIGKPFLYKRELSLDAELADHPYDLIEMNANKWFLLFPTKRHWRENSKLSDIETGLEWLEENYKSAGIRSLAVPALGCGLGGLSWQEVGPVLCQHLSRLDIQVAIYLPREQEIHDQFLTEKFLLKR